MRNHIDGRTRQEGCSALRQPVSDGGSGGYRASAGSVLPNYDGDSDRRDDVSRTIARPVSESPFRSSKRHCPSASSEQSDESREVAVPSSCLAASSPPSPELPPHATGVVRSLIALYGGSGGGGRGCGDVRRRSSSQCRGNDEPYCECERAAAASDGDTCGGNHKASDERQVASACRRCNGVGDGGGVNESGVRRPVVIGRLHHSELPKQTAVATNGYFSSVDVSGRTAGDEVGSCHSGSAFGGDGSRPPRSPKSPRSPLLSKVAGLRLTVPCTSGSTLSSTAGAAPVASPASAGSSGGAMTAMSRIGCWSSDGSSGIAAATSGHPYVCSRPIIVLQRSSDSFCSTSPSPVVDCCHGGGAGGVGSTPRPPPQWPQLPALQLPPAAAATAERSRRSSSGSADSAVCDLSSAAGEAAIASDSASPAGRSSSAERRRGSDAVPNSGRNGLPSVVVEPGSPAVPFAIAACLGEASADDGGAYAGGVSLTKVSDLSSASFSYDDELHCGLEPRTRSQSDVQQRQLFLLPPDAGDALQRKASSESMCSEYSSFTCDESVDEEPTSTAVCAATAVSDARTNTAAFAIGSPEVTLRHRDRSKLSSAASNRNRAEVTAAWIQLAGHRGTFLPFRTGTILKKHCAMEEKALLGLMDDPLRPFVPELYGLVDKDGDKYIEIQDLLAGFCEPSVMDCKIGVRTYLEDELEKALKNPQPRQDMYDKMVKVDPNEPTAEEHRQRGVTKPRYMQWRERVSSSEKLGFRIEAVRRSDGTAVTDFKKTRDQESVVQELLKFTRGRCDTLSTYLERLIVMRRVMEESSFLARHEVIGSSLLFVHDGQRAEVWMIDFGKTLPLASGTSVTHRAPWLLGNHEDGYLTGIDNVIAVLAATVQQAAAATACCSSPADADATP